MNRQMTALSGLLVCLLALGFSDTAHGQSVTVSPQMLSFTAPTNTQTPTQAVAVTTAPANASVIVSGLSASWITVTQGSFNTPANLNVAVNTTGLAQANYSATFTVSFSGNPSIFQTVTVNLTVTGASALSANPASLNFAGQAGATSGTPQSCATQNSPSTCQVTISSTGAQVNYSVTPSATWIQVDRAMGTVGGSPLNIGVNPSAITAGAGTYTGSVIVQSLSSSDSVSIGVTLVIGANATLSVSPTQLNFFYQTGTANPASQTVTLTSSGGFVPFQVSQNFPSWLNVTPVSGSVNSSAPVTLTVGVTPNSPTALSTGNHTATLTISPSGGAPLTVTVNLYVSNNPFLTLSTTQLNFNMAFAGSVPASQTVTVGSTGAPLSFTASASSDVSWLTVSPGLGTTGQPSGTLTVGVSSANVLQALAVGTYHGTITVTPVNGDAYTLQVAATLTVNASSQIMSAPQAAFFSYEIGQAQPSTQTLALSTTGPPVNFTVSTVVGVGGSCVGSNWLSAVAQVSPLATPDSLNVSVNTSGLGGGTCLGTIKVQYGASQETDVPVTLFVSGSTTPLLNISLPQGFGVETVTLGGSSIQRTISLSSTDGSTAIPYQVSFQSAPCAWLFATASTGMATGVTPTPVSVLISPGCITNPGMYQGSITLTSSGLPQPVTLAVTLIVNSNTIVHVSPSSLTFNQAQGGASPSPQTLTFSVSAGSASFIATPTTTFGGNWLSVTPTSGSTSVGTLSVTASSTTLPANTYTGAITITLTGSATTQIQIPVTFIIGAAQTLTVTPALMAFSYTLGGPAPPAQVLAVGSTGGTVNFSVGTTSTGGWLLSDTTSGTTTPIGAKGVNISIDPTKIPVGTIAGNTLSGSISVSAPTISSTPTIVPVTLSIVAVAVPQPSTITNSALPNTGFGAIAPGELITIKGSNLGPATPASFTVTPQNTVNSTLAGVQVLFDGQPGTPTYVSANQINVIVPWEIAGRTSTNVVVVFSNVQSAPIPQQVTSVAPGIFTLTATGAGQAAAVNLTGAAAGTINGPPGGVTVGSTVIPTQPAAAGSFIAVYGNGGGATNPASVTGSVTPSTPLYPLSGWTQGSSVVTATIGGAAATVEFAGAAPTLVNGILQVNLQVPNGVHGNNLAVVITIDGVPTPGGATVAVQ